VSQALEDREVRQRGDQAARHDDGLATDLVRQPAEQNEKRRADRQAASDQQVGGGRIDLQGLRQEEQRIELAGVPHHRLPGRRAEQCE
jgi:hypothetical protein